MSKPKVKILEWDGGKQGKGGFTITLELGDDYLSTNYRNEPERQTALFKSRIKAKLLADFFGGSYTEHINK